MVTTAVRRAAAADECGLAVQEDQERGVAGAPGDRAALEAVAAAVLGASVQHGAIARSAASTGGHSGLTKRGTEDASKQFTQDLTPCRREDECLSLCTGSR